MNTVSMVSTKVRRTTLDNLRELYAMRYARSKESMAAILDRLVKAELERIQAEELEQLLDMRSAEMRSDPAQRIPLTKEELVRRGLIDG